MAKFQIEIPNFHGGLAPGVFSASTSLYNTYGNRNQANVIVGGIDLTNTFFMQQGPGFANLTNGTQAAAVTTLIRSVLDYPVATDATYGVGGNKLHQISSTAVTNAGSWPHTIDKAAVTGEDGEDVVAYQGNLYYSYNHSGSAGDIGKYDLSSTFDDDWGSTVPTGAAALQNAPHQMVVGGNDILYIANGRYVASYDGTTFQAQALDLPTGTVIQSIAWNNDRLWISAINPDISTTANRVKGSVYIWDGTADSWEYEVVIPGAVGGLYVKSGILYTFYYEVADTTQALRLAYVDNGGLHDIAFYGFFTGLPKYYQITTYKNFVIWHNASGNIFAFGAEDLKMPARLFLYTFAGDSTDAAVSVGAVKNPFGTPMVGMNSGSTYTLRKFSGFMTNTVLGPTYRSILFDITGFGRVSKIDGVRINFEKLTSGALVVWSLIDSKGVTIYTDTISFTKLGAVTTAYYPLNGKVAENFQLFFNFTTGSTSATVKLKNAKIFGSID